MQLLLRFAVLLILAITIGVFPGGHVVAVGRGPDLAATILADKPAQPSLKLQNISSSDCQVATTAQGTIAITKLMQDGKVLQPNAADTATDEDIGYLLQSQLKLLKPGESTQIMLPIYNLSSGHIVRTTAWSSDAGAFSTEYTINANKPLQMELNYSLPITPKSGAPACSAIFASTISDTSLPSYLIIIAVGIVGLAAVIVALWLLRKRNKIAPKTVVSVLLALGMCGLLSPAPASATVTVPPEMQGAFDTCMATLEANRDITGPVLDAINNPANHIEIVATTGGSETTGYRTPTGANFTIYWNPNHRGAYAGTGGNADPCTSLYHEMFHVLDMHNGTFSRDDCAGSGIETKEVMATRAQNVLRKRLGLPERSHYGDRALPTGNCSAPANPAQCDGPHCGDTNGDPHLRTFDGLRYDFQAAGEFVAARNTSGAYEIQVRQEPWLDSRVVSINTAVAFKVGNDKLEIRAGKALQLLVNGSVQSIEATKLPGGGQVDVVSGVVIATWPDGSKAYIRSVGPHGLALSVQPSSEIAGTLEGLLGDANGKSDNDLRVRGSDKPLKPVFDQLYPAFADSWRIHDRTSLFTYEKGKNTNSYTNRDFPDDMGDPKNLPGYAAALAYCKTFAISDEVALANCALDVALTGRPEFARAAANSQVFAAGAHFNGTTWQLVINKSGDSASVTFDATAGEKVFISVLQSTLPSRCGNLKLSGPDGEQITNGCIINGVGQIDGTVLPIAGTYTLSLTSEEAGTATTRLLRIADKQSEIAPDGPKITARIDQPGVVGRYTFDGRAGQRIYLAVPASTLKSQCGLLRLVGPDGGTITSGCIINGEGELDTATLPQDGQYTIVLDPTEMVTGTAELRLIQPTADTKPITLDGPILTAALTKPGSIAQFTFNGQPGQRIYVDIPSSKLDSRCGVLRLRSPDGSIIHSGCIINGKGDLGNDGVMIPVGGTYTVILDPVDADTGTSTIRLRSR